MTLTSDFLAAVLADANEQYFHDDDMNGSDLLWLIKHRIAGHLVAAGGDADPQKWLKAATYSPNV